MNSTMMMDRRSARNSNY